MGGIATQGARLPPSAVLVLNGWIIALNEIM
jgi:hypothetical protein